MKSENYKKIAKIIRVQWDKLIEAEKSSVRGNDTRIAQTSVAQIRDQLVDHFEEEERKTYPSWAWKNKDVVKRLEENRTQFLKNCGAQTKNPPPNK